MNQFIKDQIKLYRHFGFPEPDGPHAIDVEFMSMRLNFMLEELNELAEGAGFTLCADGRYNHVGIPMDAEKILDGLVDLSVVLLGTVYLLGFLRTYYREGMNEKIRTHFEEAWNRVFEANMKKVVGSRKKRGHQLDLRKPEGWEPPVLEDLVRGYYGKCKDCGGFLTRVDYLAGHLKCAACHAVSEGE